MSKNKQSISFLELILSIISKIVKYILSRIHKKKNQEVENIDKTEEDAEELSNDIQNFYDSVDVENDNTTNNEEENVEDISSNINDRF